MAVHSSALLSTTGADPRSAWQQPAPSKSGKSGKSAAPGLLALGTDTGLVVVWDVQRGEVVHFEDVSEVVPVPPRDDLSANWVLPAAEERRAEEAAQAMAA